MANEQKLAKVGTVLFRGGAGCILLIVMACVAILIYEWIVSGDGSLFGILSIMLVVYVAPIGVVAVVVGILLRMIAHIGSSGESTGDE